MIRNFKGRIGRPYIMIFLHSGDET